MKNFQIFITTLDPSKGMRKLLMSLDKSAELAGIKANISVLFQNSTSLENFPTLNFIELTSHMISSSISLSDARNYGITNCQFEWIVFLDDDCYVDTSFFHELISVIQNPEQDLISFRILGLDHKTPFNNSFNDEVDRKLNYWNYEYFLGGGFACRSKIFESNEKFNLNLSVGSKYGSGEETDLLFKMMEKGYVAKYCPLIKIYHPINQSINDKIIAYGIGFSACMTYAVKRGNLVALAIWLKRFFGLLYYGLFPIFEKRRILNFKLARLHLHIFFKVLLNEK